MLFLFYYNILMCYTVLEFVVIGNIISGCPVVYCWAAAAAAAGVLWRSDEDRIPIASTDWLLPSRGSSAVLRAHTHTHTSKASDWKLPIINSLLFVCYCISNWKLDGGWILSPRWRRRRRRLTVEAGKELDSFQLQTRQKRRRRSRRSW